jgi:hypothetical protein
LGEPEVDDIDDTGRHLRTLELTPREVRLLLEELDELCSVLESALASPGHPRSVAFD